VPRPVEIPGAHRLTISSTIVGRDFDLYVQLPRTYSDPARTFPVVYVLDAQWDFTLVTAIYGSQYYDGFVPGLIIVGITWGGTNANYDSLRAADLTPTNSKSVPQSGNAPRFLSCIQNEIIPFVDSQFRTRKDDRTLMGSSYGGLFTLYALFQESKLFQRYVLTSPSVEFDNGVFYSFEKQYADQHSSLPVRLFMAEGGLEGGLAAYQKLVDHLKLRRYGGLNMETRILENMGHSGGKAEGYTRGLQWVFERTSVPLTPVTIRQYEGTYEVRPGVQIRFREKDGRLTFQPPGNPVVILQSEGNDGFYAKGYFLNIRFNRDLHGDVTGCILEQYGGSMVAKKLSNDQ
jgi:hypothetical protein